MTTFKRFLTPFSLAALLLLTASGLMTGWTARLTAPLTQRNLVFLDASIRDTFHLMIPVGAAKAAADIVEGSTLNVEAGAVFAKAGMTIDLKEKAVVLKDKLSELGLYAKDAISDVAFAVCTLAAVKLLNGVVFPLASFGFLIWLVRGCLWPVLGLSERPLAGDDLRRLSDFLRPPHDSQPPPS